MTAWLTICTIAFDHFVLIDILYYTFMNNDNIKYNCSIFYVGNRNAGRGKYLSR